VTDRQTHADTDTDTHTGAHIDTDTHTDTHTHTHTIPYNKCIVTLINFVQDQFIIIPFTFWSFKWCLP
jgi:hypothetical protein